MDLELAGKRAIVTGGSRGIGKAVARQLALEGAWVAIAARDRPRLDATVAELAAATEGEVFGTVVETSDRASIEAMTAAVTDRFGGIDILVNCAAEPAGQKPVPQWDAIEEEDLMKEIRVKVLGYLRTAQAVVPHMIEAGWGRIVNVSGTAARSTGSPIGTIRNISVAAMTKNLADDLAPHNISVVTVHPGGTRTEATALLPERPVTNLAGRLIDAEEVADVITFLASRRAVAINGDVIAAGGGVPRAIYF